MSLPEYTTLNMSSPIFAGIFAIILLNEKFNFYIVISLFCGFLGVLCVVQPGFENFNIYFLLTLLGAFLITFTTVIVNKYNTVTSTVGYFIYGGLFTHLLSLVLFIFDPLLMLYSMQYLLMLFTYTPWVMQNHAMQSPRM